MSGYSGEPACAIAMASATESARSQPGAVHSRLRLTTSVRRPGSGRPMESQVSRPMMSVCPVVVRLKCCSSSGMCQGSALPWPMTPLRARAISRVTRGLGIRVLRVGSDRDRRLDQGVRVVALEAEVVVAVVEDRLGTTPDHEPGQGPGVAGQLLAGLVEVIEVQVAITSRPDEVACFQARLLRDHFGEQGVGSDVERHAEEDVGAALVELAREPAAGDMELKERVAGSERHPGQV